MHKSYVTYYICIYSCDCHSDQHMEYFYHSNSENFLRSFPVDIPSSPKLITIQTQQHYWLNLPVLELHITVLLIGFWFLSLNIKSLGLIHVLVHINSNYNIFLLHMEALNVEDWGEFKNCVSDISGIRTQAQISARSHTENQKSKAVRSGGIVENQSVLPC